MTIAHIYNGELGFDVRTKLNALIDQVASIPTGGTGTGDVVGPASAINDHLAAYNGVTGKLIKDGGASIAEIVATAVLSSGDVDGPAGAVADHIATYNGTTGKLIKDSGQSFSSLTFTSSQITDFAESTDDRVAGLLVAGSNITLTYNDPANTLTITAASGGSSRTVLATDTSYYVNNTTGNDANSGAVGAPWATLQHVADYLAEHVDLNNKIVTIHVADSVTVYPGVSFRPLIGGGDLVFLGNNTTLGNVKIGNSPEVAAVFSSAGLGGTLFWISGFEFVQTNGAALDFDGTDRGTCLLGEPTFLLSSCNKFSSCQNNGYVLIGNIFDNSLGTSIIDGTALNAHTPKSFYGCFNATTYGAYINLPNFSITGTVTFSKGFAGIYAGFASFNGLTIGAGVVHGRKFDVNGGSIYLDSITQLPGDIPGVNYGGLIGINSSDACWIGPWPTAKSLQTLTTGFSITIADTVGALILKPAGTLAAGAITLPANPIDQQRLTINSTATITALTISPNAGQSVIGNPATIVGGTAITAIYNYSDTTWYMASSPTTGGSMAIGGAITSATAGSVLFAGAAGVLAQDNAGFFWNASLKDLHIGGAYYVNAARALYSVPNVTENNWFEGNAGNQTVTGYGNFATGDLSLSAITSGYQNVAMGTGALKNITTGYGNFAMGTHALYLTDGGDNNNIAIGASALQSIGQFGTGGGGNAANICLGYSAMGNMIYGDHNVAIGFQPVGSLTGTTVASYNTVIGNGAGNNLGSGGGTPVQYNTLLGPNAGANLTGTSSNNTWVGGYRGPSAVVSTSLAFSDGPGIYALLDWNVSSNGVWSFANAPGLPRTALHIYNNTGPIGVPGSNYERAILDWSLVTDVFTIGTQRGGTGVLRPVNIIGSALTFNGSPIGGGGGGMSIGGSITSATAGSVLFAGAAGVLAQDNTNFFWDDALNDLHIGGAYYVSSARALYVVPNVSGSNWFEGNAGNQTLTGYANFGTGDLALSELTSGANNVAVGTQAMRRSKTSYSNFAMGYHALYESYDGAYNTAIGSNALETLGLLGAGPGFNNYNVAIGTGALGGATQASNTVAIGFGALAGIVAPTVSDANTVIGGQAANSLGTGGGALVSSNTFIGQQCGKNITGGNSNTWFGGQFGPSGTISNSIVIADGSGNRIIDNSYTTPTTWTMSATIFNEPCGLHIYGKQNAIGPSMVNWERAILDWNNTANVFTIRAQAGGTGVIRLISIDGFAKAGAPAAGDLPSGSFAVIDDTSGGATWLAFNKSGTIRKVQLT